jgi:hypothetical protein
MNYREYVFGRYETDIAAAAEKYNLSLNDLEVESFSPAGLAIFVEKIEGKRFKIHINLQEGRIISVQIMGSESADRNNEALFAKYKSFMK